MSRTDERLFVTMALDILSHPKLDGATAAAKWAFAASMIVSKRELSDGVVRPSVVYAEAEVTQRAGTELLRRNLWHGPGHDCDRCAQPPEGRVIVHDYLLHQASRADVEETRRRKSAAGRKGAAARWGDGSSHGTSHSGSHGRTDGRANADAMAETWPESETESEKDSMDTSSRRLTSARATLTDDEMIRIEEATGGDRRHAERVVADVLSRAAQPPKRALAYVLRAIGSEPERYKPTSRGVRKGELCKVSGHSDKARGCKQCAADRAAGE